MLTYCLNKYKTQKISDKAADAFLPTLNFVADCYVTSKMLEKLDVIFSNDDLDLDDADSDIVTFFSNDMGQNTIYLNNNNLDVDNFDEGDPTRTVHVRHIT